MSKRFSAWRGPDARFKQQRSGPPRIDGLHYDAKFLSAPDRQQILDYLGTIHPLWEKRYSEFRPIPEGQAQRPLLRPVYWLGSWQFACLDYYRPPHGIKDRAVRAEPFPPVLQKLVAQIEKIAQRLFLAEDLPEGWALNTCLINLYGRKREGDKWVDTARVGEHKDFEPGPVASLSLGERALFQFVQSQKPGERDGVTHQQWLDDGSLQIFGTDRWKKRVFHRVQRVDHKGGHNFPLNVTDFETRRINFTFRFVPQQHLFHIRELSPEARTDVDGYLRTLAAHSAFFAEASGHPSQK